MAQNINPEHSYSSILSKQNEETNTVKDNHAVSKRYDIQYSICTFDRKSIV